MTAKFTTPPPLPVWTIPARIAVMIAVTFGVIVLLSVLTQGLAPTEPSTLAARIAGGTGVSVVIVGLIVLVVRVVEHRRLSDVGVPPLEDGWRAFLVGFAAWLLPAAATFAVLALLGLPVSITASAGRFVLVVALLFLAVLISEAVPEELVFRGYVTAVLAERLRGWWVVLIQTALFTLVVLLLRGGLSLLDVSLFIAMGIVLGYIRMVTGSVWTAVGFHAGFQTGSQLLLTHEVVEFAGSPAHAMFALGAVPFTAAAILVPILTAARPSLIARHP